MTRTSVATFVGTLLVVTAAGPWARPTATGGRQRRASALMALQPRVAVDVRGGVHVVYFTGAAAAGDLFYSRLDATGPFTPAVRVNSRL